MEQVRLKTDGNAGTAILQLLGGEGIKNKRELLGSGKKSNIFLLLSNHITHEALGIYRWAKQPWPVLENVL